MILTFNEHRPDISRGVFVAENATIIGDVKIDEDSSIWFGAVVRGDVHRIRVGKRTNVQDQCVLHVDCEHGLDISEDVTIGHAALVHGCTIGPRVLIGMGAIILSGARIEEDSIIGAGAVVTEDAVIPARSLVLGVPGKIRRSLTDEERRHILLSAEEYVHTAQAYRTTSSG